MEGYDKTDVIWRPIEELTKLANNPRTITKEEMDKLMRSIKRNKKFFSANPLILSDRTGELVIIGGNQRLEAAKRLGLTEVPTILMHNPTEREERETVILDNHSNGEYDMDILANEYGDLDLPELMGNEYPSDLFEEEEKEIVEDEVPEPPKEPKSKLGDIYQLGNHRLMCGDSTKKEDVETLMGGVQADMVFTDPPYNVAIGDKNKALNTFAASQRIERNLAGDTYKNDTEAGEKLWLPAFENMLRVSNDICSIYVTMPQGGTHMMMMMMAEAGWQVKHELIWAKNSPTFSMGRLDYDYQHEPICFGWNKGHKKIGKGKFTKSIWQIDKPRKDGEHPTMKPVELIANAIQNSSENADVILDLFGGSGSTLMACEQTNRKCYMMELDPHYVDVIIQRWENFTGKKAVLLEGVNNA